MSDVAAATAPTISARDVEGWCAPSDVREGRKYLAKVQEPWQGGNKIHAKVQGSGSVPYQIDVTFKEEGAKPSTKCSCPAWRKNPFCKHVAAVLLAWANKPGSFTVVEAPPTEVNAKAARAPKKGAGETNGASAEAPAKAKTSAEAEAARLAQLENGLAQAADLLTELCARGLLATTTEQVDAVLKLAELLIDQKLNALGRSVQLLSIRLRQLSAAGAGARAAQEKADEAGFAALLADTWLTLAATRRALRADPTSGESAGDLEELLGTRFDDSRLNKFESEALLELAFAEERDEVGYTIGTSYLLNLENGEILLDWKSVPTRLADREGKRPYNCLLVKCKLGSSRSQAPRRVKVSNIGQRQAITAEVVARAAGQAVTSVAELRRRFIAQTSDPLAERALLALYAPEALQVVEVTSAAGKPGQGLLLVDGAGQALPVEGAVSTVMWTAPHDPIRAIFGKLKLNERGDGLVLAPLSLLCESGKVRMLG